MAITDDQWREMGFDILDLKAPTNVDIEIMSVVEKLLIKKGTITAGEVSRALKGRYPLNLITERMLVYTTIYGYVRITTKTGVKLSKQQTGLGELTPLQQKVLSVVQRILKKRSFCTAGEVRDVMGGGKCVYSALEIGQILIDLCNANKLSRVATGKGVRVAV
jgi:hypothetical protein